MPTANVQANLGLRRAGYTTGTGPKGLTRSAAGTRRIQTQRKLARQQMLAGAGVLGGSLLVAAPLLLGVRGVAPLVSRAVRGLKPMSFARKLVRAGRGRAKDQVKARTQGLVRGTQMRVNQQIDNAFIRIFGTRPGDFQRLEQRRRELEQAMRNSLAPEKVQPGVVTLASRRGTLVNKLPTGLAAQVKEALIDKADRGLQKGLLFLSPMHRRAMRTLNRSRRRNTNRIIRGPGYEGPPPAITFAQAQDLVANKKIKDKDGYTIWLDRKRNVIAADDGAFWTHKDIRRFEEHNEAYRIVRGQRYRLGARLKEAQTAGASPARQKDLKRQAQDLEFEANQVRSQTSPWEVMLSGVWDDVPSGRVNRGALVPLSRGQTSPLLVEQPVYIDPSRRNLWGTKEIIIKKKPNTVVPSNPNVWNLPKQFQQDTTVYDVSPENISYMQVQVPTVRTRGRK